MECCLLGMASADHATSKGAGDFSDGLSLLFIVELAVKINPACTETSLFGLGALQADGATSLVFTPTPSNTRRAGKAPRGTQFGHELYRRQLMLGSCLCVVCPCFIPLLPKGTGSLHSTVNPPFSSPFGRNEWNKYLYLSIEKQEAFVCLLGGEGKEIIWE